MALNKLLLIGGTTLAIGLASVAGAGVVSAENGTNGNVGIADRIAQKFNLKSADVQKVFEEQRATHEAEHKATLNVNLDQAVTDGKITADQKTKLVAKLEEMKANRPDFRNMTEAERTAAKTAMETKRTEFEAWLKANNIPTDILPNGGMGGPRGGHGNSSRT